MGGIPWTRNRRCNRRLSCRACACFRTDPGISWPAKTRSEQIHNKKEWNGFRWNSFRDFRRKDYRHSDLSSGPQSGPALQGLRKYCRTFSARTRRLSFHRKVRNPGLPRWRAFLRTWDNRKGGCRRSGIPSPERTGNLSPRIHESDRSLLNRRGRLPLFWNKRKQPVYA